MHLDMMEKFLTGQTSVVSGASRDRGIGAAICRSLAAAGSNIFFTSWQPYDASMAEPEFPGRFVQELQQQSVDAAWLELDLADPIAPKQLIAIVKRRFGTAHNLINNACYSVKDNYSTIDANTLDKCYAINIRAPILLSAEFVRCAKPFLNSTLPRGAQS